MLMQIKSNDKEEYDDTLLSNECKINYFKAQVEEMENEINEIIAESPILSKLPIELFRTDKKQQADALIETITQGIVTMLQTIDDAIRSKDVVIANLQEK